MNQFVKISPIDLSNLTIKINDRINLNDRIKMTVYFTKNDDFHINMKKLNMFNFLHFKMMKILFKLSDTVVFSWRQREMCILVYVFK